MSHTAILQPDRRVPTGARRAVISAGLRHLARKMETSHPALGTPGHLRDAARELDRGNTDGAQRHLRAGMLDMQPVNLIRHGITEDGEHTGARQHLTSIHRQLLNVKDVEETMHTHRPPLPLHGPSFAPSVIEGEPDTPGFKRGNQAMNAPAKSPVGRSDGAARGPAVPAPSSAKQKSYARPGTSLLDLSAQTARLAVTPAPRGRPGGPGLYDVKGNEHSPYFQQVVKALIEKRGMPPGRAYAIAWGALRRWRDRSKHPEVRAAAAGSLALEGVARARAHAHSWADVETAIELATLDFGGPGSGNPGQQRDATGKFTASGSQRQPAGHPARTAAVARHPAGSMNHAQRAHAKQALLGKAHALDQKANGIAAQIRALLQGLHNQASSAGSGSSSAAAGSSKSSAAGASTSSAASKSSSPSTSGSSTSTSTRTASQVNARVAQLRSQEHALRAQARGLRSQAAKL